MSAASLRRIVAFRLVAHDPIALARFYGDALGAVRSGSDRLSTKEHDLLGTGERTSLTVGGERLDLDAFAEPGAAYPEGIAADDPRFQHCAFVVADIVAAYERAVACGAGAISKGGPIELPDSSGGVTAVKLRDPEGHPFELIHFPAGSQPRWDTASPNARGVFGIDHSAITVRDVSASSAFYARCGLTAAEATINRGPTQAALDGLEAPIVDVVPLNPVGSGPHLELLGYRVAKPAAARRGLRDVAATRIAWASDGDGLLFDPDGHCHQLVAK